MSWHARWTVPLAGVVALAAVLAGAAAWGVPEPTVHDELSYLLAADTFRHGRLANPPHPHWQHFEVPHVLQRPTYVSKYPPAQGLAMGAGWAIFGHPIAGVWATVAALGAALVWMLRGWVPAGWAFAGGVGGAVLWGALGYWGHSYWGGAVAACGGALVFGALPRLLRRPRARDAALLGGGLLVLVFSRPFEGALVSAVAVLPLAAAVWRRRRESVTWTRLVAPVVVCLALAAGLFALYDRATTGRATVMPYMLYERTYSPLPLSLLGTVRPLPEYRQPILRRLYARSVWRFREQRTWEGWRHRAERGLEQLVRLVIGPWTLLPLVFLPWAWRRPGVRPALAAWGIHLLVASAMYSYFPHYSAPALPLLALLLVQCLRAAGDVLVRRRHGRSVAVALLVLWTVASGAERVVAADRHLATPPESGYARRAELVAKRFAEGRHLVLLRHGRRASIHDAWAANGADIDGQRIVWAHSLGDAADRALVAYYPGREVWRVDVGFGHRHAVRVTPWRPVAAGSR